MTNNEKLFINFVEEMEKRLHFPKDHFTIKRDNRVRGLSINLYNYVDGDKKECYLIKYNAKKLQNKLEVMLGALHEMGHVRKNHFTINHYLSLEEKEYEAEDFALNAIKKLYPEYYLRAIDYLLKYINGADKLYANAFQKLYDERMGIK